MPSQRTIRYQGAILRDDQILLIRHQEHASGRSYWVIPGGGREPDETEEACVQREMREETNLEVRVEKLLLDEDGAITGIYQRLRTYLCTIIKGGEARPGYEPEPAAAEQYAIAEVRWFDLKDIAALEKEAGKDPFTYPLVQRIRVILGYSRESSTNGKINTRA